MVAVRCLSTMTVATGVDSIGLGRWAWMHMGGGGKTTHVLVAYHPCQPHHNTGSNTIWDQYLCYFEARGNAKCPIQNLHDDLVYLLTKWKHAGDKIVIMGEFNEDVYNGVLSVHISSESLQLHKLCLRTTGQPLPQTHNCGRLPINAIFGTVGVDSTAVTLLLFGAGVRV